MNGGMYMYHNYRYSVTFRVPGGGTVTRTGMYTNLRSEAEAVATLKRQYSNIVDYDVWEA